MKNTIMECGHSANSTHAQNHDELGENHPACVICNCCKVAKNPDLSGRKAKCAYRNCGNLIDSDLNLAFFEYLPDEKFDRYYCGCKGWD